MFVVGFLFILGSLTESYKHHSDAILYCLDVSCFCYVKSADLSAADI